MNTHRPAAALVLVQMGYAPHNQEFTELISAAAEQALRQEDTALREQVLALAKVKSCRCVQARVGRGWCGGGCCMPAVGLAQSA